MNVMRAAVVGDVEAVKQWLSAPGHRHTGQAGLVLRDAAKYGHDIICQLVLNSGHISDNDIANALANACQNNRLSTAQLLVRHAHINTQNLTEALLQARVEGHIRIVKWLISDVLTLSHTDRIRWLLIAACARGDMSDIQQLATQVDSDVTRVMSQALRVACDNGRDDVVKWLMSHTTADASSLGLMYATLGEVSSLMAACFRSHYGLVRQLLQCVTPHAVNVTSGIICDTALNFIVCSEFKANLKLIGACMNGDFDAAADIVHKSNLNLQVDTGTTALHWACSQGHEEIVKVLLADFAIVDVKDDLRCTPAMWAKKYGHKNVLSCLQITDCTVSATPDSHVHVSDNNNTVSMSSVLSVEHVTKPNIRNIKSHSKAKLSTIRLV